MRSTPVLAASALFATASAASAAPPDAPSEVVAYCPNQSRVHLSWKDNSDDETDWLVDRWVPGAEPGEGEWQRASGGVLPADFEVWRGTASTAAQTFRLRVAPWKPGESESVLNWVEAEVEKPSGPLDLFLNGSIEIPEGSSGRAGEFLSFQIEVFGGFPDRYLARDLPAGLLLDDSTGIVSGVVAAPGVYRCLVGVEFNGGERFERAHFLRILPAPSTPVVTSPGFSVPVQNVGIEGFVDIGSLFADPAREKGAWFQVGGASIVVALHDTATPKTVENFLGYVRRGDYNGTYIHRSDPNFVVQAGGYGPFSPTAPPTSWRAVPKLDPIQNEPGLSNTRGTIAMAKLGGNRDSATSEWFLNVDTLGDNAANLDFQNGGFTVFGEIVGSGGIAVMDAINDLPRLNRNGQITGVPGTALGSLPVLDASDPNSFLSVRSISEVRPLSVVVVANSAPAVLSAEATGPLLFIRSLGRTGTANLLLRATNLDGNTVDFTLPIRIDDLERPVLRLTALRGTNRFGTILVRGIARDAVALKNWRYRVNRKRWLNGGRLSGKSAPFSARIRGFRRGGNLLEVEVFDARRNGSGVVRQRFTLR